MRRRGRRHSHLSQHSSAPKDDVSKDTWAFLAQESLQLAPMGFFAVQGECRRYKAAKGHGLDDRYLLPGLAPLYGSASSFASVALAWDADGVRVGVKVSEPMQQAFFPEIQRGDSIELFFDTRDVKTSGFATRFCHHFYCLPKAVEGHQAGEITRFRTEDTHEWCDPKLLKVHSHLNNRGYSVDLFIPAECLHGYDPEHYSRLGFTYRVNRFGEDPQYFSVSSRDFVIEQQPSLWSSLRLVA